MGKYINPHVNAANKYARDVISGKIPACHYVKLACQRHVDDLNRSKTATFNYKFVPELGEKICKFAELLPHTKGKWKDTPIILLPWESFLLVVLFGWVKKSDGKRRFRELYAEIPRKNAKSTIGAIIGLYMFSVDREPGAEVYSGATSLDQAREVFRPAWMMAKKSPGFRNRFGIELGGTDKNPGNIYSTESDSRFEAVIGKPGDGSSVHCGIVDEYHEHLTDHMYDCFDTGLGSREQPLLIVITTAGTNTSSPCYHKRTQALKTLNGEQVNEQLFVLIYTIDKDDDWTDFKVWKKANPSFGVSVFEDYLIKQHKAAVSDARKQNILKCKHLNIWSNAAEAYFNMVDFGKVSDPTLRLEDFKGCKAYLGLDLAAKKDLAAAMLLIKKGLDYYLFSRYYLPKRETIGEDKAHYAGWEHDGYIVTTPGNRIDYEYIENDIFKLAKIVDIRGFENGGGEICNDPWNAQQLVANLEKKRLIVTEIPQTVAMLSEPMKEIDACISAGRFHHDANPVTFWCFENVMAQCDKKENVFPFKLGVKNKIDGAVATINAMCRAMTAKSKKTIKMPIAV